MSEFDTEPKMESGLDPEPIEAQPDSVMEDLRRQHQELKSSKTLDLPIPGYDGKLIARYRLIGLKELEVIGEKVQREFKGQGDKVTYASIDAIIAACRGMYYNRDGKLVGLSESISKDEPPIVYDDRLIEFLQLDISDEGLAKLMPEGILGIEKLGEARRTVLVLFGGNDIAILDHSNTIGRWSADTSKEVMQEFVGGS